MYLLQYWYAETKSPHPRRRTRADHAASWCHHHLPKQGASTGQRFRRWRSSKPLRNNGRIPQPTTAARDLPPVHQLAQGGHSRGLAAMLSARASLSECQINFEPVPIIAIPISDRRDCIISACRCQETHNQKAGGSAGVETLPPACCVS